MGEGPEGRPDAVAERSIDSPRFMWVMLAVLFGCGATIGALSVILPHPESFDDEALWSNIALAYAGGGDLPGRRPAVGDGAASTRWSALGVLAVSRAAYYSHDPSGFYSAVLRLDRPLRGLLLPPRDRPALPGGDRGGLRDPARGRGSERRRWRAG